MTERPIPITLDLDEGRYVDLGCLHCHADTRGRLGVAVPLRVYIVCLWCSQCGEQIVEWDGFMGVTRVWRSA